MVPAAPGEVTALNDDRSRQRTGSASSGSSKVQMDMGSFSFYVGFYVGAGLLRRGSGPRMGRGHPSHPLSVDPDMPEPPAPGS